MPLADGLYKTLPFKGSGSKGRLHSWFILFRVYADVNL